MSTSQTATTAPFTYKTLAEHLGRSMGSLFRDDALGRLPRGYKIGGRRYWLRAEIEAWLEAGAPERAEWDAIKKAAK